MTTEHGPGHGTAVSEAAAPDPALLEAAGDLLRALAAPVRIAIVLQLHERPRRVHE